MAKFAFFVGCLDTTDVFSREMACYLESKGHKCLEIDVRIIDKELKRFIREHAKESFSAVVSFNNVGYSLGEEGEDFWEKMDIPYVDILMDHPFHFTSKLSQLSKKTILYCVDRNHINFVKKYFPNIQNVEFLPHAGCLYESQKALYNNNKDIEILYPGSLSRTLVENLIPNFDEFMKFDAVELSKEVLSYLIKNPDSTTEDTILLSLKNRGLSLSLEEELEIISSLRFIDGFAVSYFRELSVRILTENGFKVCVLGSGWESCDWVDNKNLSVLGKVSPVEVFSFMKRSKVVLNTMTWFKEGTHDRIFNAALCKSAILTDSSGYLDEIFGGKSITCFDLKEMERLPYLAEELLSNYALRESLIDHAYEITKENHTWGHRVKKIIEDLGL